MVDVSHIGFEGSRRPHTKTRIIFVCHVMISMEGENHFSWIMLKFKKKKTNLVLSAHQAPGILYFLFFQDG